MDERLEAASRWWAVRLPPDVLEAERECFRVEVLRAIGEQWERASTCGRSAPVIAIEVDYDPGPILALALERAGLEHLLRSRHYPVVMGTHENDRTKPSGSYTSGEWAFGATKIRMRIESDRVIVPWHQRIWPPGGPTPSDVEARPEMVAMKRRLMACTGHEYEELQMQYTRAILDALAG